MNACLWGHHLYTHRAGSPAFPTAVEKGREGPGAGLLLIFININIKLRDGEQAPPPQTSSGKNQVLGDQ